MIRAITWQQFGLFILVASALYYSAIGFVFYRKNILRKLTKPRDDKGSFAGIYVNDHEEELSDDGPALPEASEKAASGNKPMQEPDLYPIANELVESIDDFIVKAGKKEHIKEEVLFGIRQLIGKYPVLHATGFKVAINNYIGIAVKNNCAFELSEVEMTSLWAR